MRQGNRETGRQRDGVDFDRLVAIIVQGSLSIATDLYDTILANTMIKCVNKDTQLVDFTSCSRNMPWDKPNAVRDITDWPADDRDGQRTCCLRLAACGLRLAALLFTYCLVSVSAFNVLPACKQVTK